MDLPWFILIGLGAGWLSGRLMKGGFGLLGDLVIGLIGALLGGFLFSETGVGPTGLAGALLAATVGAILLLLLLNLIKKTVT